MDWMLAPFLLPYLGLVGYDASLHPRRRVPRLESILHATAGVSVTAFLVLSLLRHDGFALACLSLAVPAMLADEFGFHRGLGRHERRIHLSAFLALCIYVGAWTWIRSAA